MHVKGAGKATVIAGTAQTMPVPVRAASSQQLVPPARLLIALARELLFLPQQRL